MSTRVDRKCCAAILPFALLCLSGCPKEEAAASPDAGDQAHGTSMCPATTPETTIGMIAMGAEGKMQAELLDADDLPPRLKPNHWQIQIQDTDGEPVDDAEIDLKLYMPAHNHDGLRDPQITSLGDGKFDIEDMNLWMTGGWEIQVSVNGAEDFIVFYICVV